MSTLRSRTITARAELAQIITLRTRVLRPHFAPGQLADFQGDDDAHTWHAALWQDDEVVGCLTMMQRAFDTSLAVPASWHEALHHATTWQLRGMAVDATCRGQGLGQQLLDFTLSQLHEGDLVWCNAREAAINLYKRAGFSCVSDMFELPLIGPHVVMGRVIR